MAQARRVAVHNTLHTDPALPLWRFTCPAIDDRDIRQIGEMGKESISWTLKMVRRRQAKDSLDLLLVNWRSIVSFATCGPMCLKKLWSPKCSGGECKTRLSIVSVATLFNSHGSSTSVTSRVQRKTSSPSVLKCSCRGERSGDVNHAGRDVCGHRILESVRLVRAGIATTIRRKKPNEGKVTPRSESSVSDENDDIAATTAPRWGCDRLTQEHPASSRTRKFGRWWGKVGRKR